MVPAYIVSAAVSLVVFFIIIISDEFRKKNQILQAIIILLSNAGYLSLALSDSLGEAVLATKLTYIGGMFAPLMLFLVITDLCRVKMPKQLESGLLILQGAMYLIVCMIGYNDWYYKDMSFVKADGMGTLEKSYGPVHTAYLISMVVYCLASIAVVIYSIRRKNKISTHNIILMFIMLALIVIVSRLEKVLNVEIIPLMYVVAEIGIYVVVFKINRYSVDHNIGGGTAEPKPVGYIILNKKDYFMDCNRYMISISPEMSDFSLEEPIPKGSLLAEKILPLAEKIKNGYQPAAEDKETLITIDERIYNFSLVPLYYHGKHAYAYLLGLEDVTDRQRYIDMLDEYNSRLEEDVRNKTQRIRDIQQKTLLGMAQMVESRDLSTGGHIKRTSLVVSIFSKALLKADMGFDEKFLNYVERSAPMHDLGKIAVDDVILRKQGKFTDEEYEIMKNHSAAGAKIVSDILTGIEEEEFVKIAVNVAHYHHEKVNGKGYPEGLKGDEIPLEARIMALADVFDALVSKRCYKDAFMYDKAFQIIEEDAGTHFDAKLAEIFISCRPELEKLYNSFT